MAKVWEGSQHEGTKLLMLLAIADFADDDGRAYPSVDTLAIKCRMQPRNARYILGELQRSGELQVQVNGGPRGANRYRIVFSALPGLQRSAGAKSSAGVQPSAGVQSSVPTPATECREPLQHGAAESSLNHQEPPKDAKAKHGRKKSEKQTFKAWYVAAHGRNPEVFDKDDPTFAYLETIGLTYEFMLVHWRWFKAKQLEGKKLQADWPQTFRNSIKGNYGRLWWRTSGGEWRLTTAGKQVAIEHGYDENMTCGAAAADWTRRAA
jgi:hypothetical protein